MKTKIGIKGNLYFIDNPEDISVSLLPSKIGGKKSSKYDLIEDVPVINTSCNSGNDKEVILIAIYDEVGGGGPHDVLAFRSYHTFLSINDYNAFNNGSVSLHYGVPQNDVVLSEKFLSFFENEVELVDKEEYVYASCVFIYLFDVKNVKIFGTVENTKPPKPDFEANALLLEKFAARG